MDYIINLFNINTTLFTLWDYQMSYIEFFGTIFSIWCVYLTARAKVLSWPVGILGTILFLFLFYQIHLYSDMIEQVYFLATGFLGWWAWTHPRTTAASDENKQLKITFNTVKQNILYGVGVLVGTLILTFIVTHLDNWLPRYFPVEASFAFIDALTTVMSFLAQYLLIRKKVENWVLWIIIDVIGIWLYYQKGVKFISMEYILFLGIASYGLWGWIKQLRKDKVNDAQINVQSHEQETIQI